jgi:hypothetical protein
VYALWYPGAKRKPTTITHPARPATWGAIAHWTVGHEQGDVITLDGPGVDCHLYAAKDGDIYQFAALDRVTYHAFHEANTHCISIETEGAGEPWTSAQFQSMARIAAFLNAEWRIPLRHVDPVRRYADGLMPPPPDWHGWAGHRDLAGIDGNNHSDTVPPGTGWGPFLAAAQKLADGVSASDLYARVVLDGGRLDVAGWEQAKGVIRWIALNGLDTDRAAIAWKGPNAKTPTVWRGKKDVTAVCKSIYDRFIAKP